MPLSSLLSLSEISDNENPSEVSSTKSSFAISPNESSSTVSPSKNSSRLPSESSCAMSSEYNTFSHVLENIKHLVTPIGSNEQVYADCFSNPPPPPPNNSEIEDDDEFPLRRLFQGPIEEEEDPETYFNPLYLNRLKHFVNPYFRAKNPKMYIKHRPISCNSSFRSKVLKKEIKTKLLCDPDTSDRDASVSDTTEDSDEECAKILGKDKKTVCHNSELKNSSVTASDEFPTCDNVNASDDSDTNVNECKDQETEDDDDMPFSQDDLMFPRRKFLDENHAWYSYTKHHSIIMTRDAATSPMWSGDAFPELEITPDEKFDKCRLTDVGTFVKRPPTPPTVPGAKRNKTSATIAKYLLRRKSDKMRKKNLYSKFAYVKKPQCKKKMTQNESQISKKQKQDTFDEPQFNTSIPVSIPLDLVTISLKHPQKE